MEYLEKWETRKENKEWKFSKSKQVWLLKNLYHLEKVPAKHFKILLSYIDTVQGASKERLIKEAADYLGDKSKIPMDILET